MNNKSIWIFAFFAAAPSMADNFESLRAVLYENKHTVNDLIVSLFKGAHLCRTVDSAKIDQLQLSDQIKELRFFDNWACAGNEIGRIDHKGSFGGIKGAKSCQIVPKESSNSVPTDMRDYQSVLVKHSDSEKIVDSNTTLSNSTNSSVHAAVLFEQTQFGGIKHWIDGQIGECRGLSGVPVGSVKMISAPGADPVVSSIPDDVTLAFFDSYGCSGNIIGAVTGSSANVPGMLNNTLLNNLAVPCDDSNGTLRVGGTPLSVRWVATGVTNKYWSMQYDGKTDYLTMSTAASITSKSLLSTLLAVTAVFMLIL